MGKIFLNRGTHSVSHTLSEKLLVAKVLSKQIKNPLKSVLNNLRKLWENLRFSILPPFPRHPPSLFWLQKKSRKKQKSFVSVKDLSKPN